jgi:hypothetical protein
VKHEILFCGNCLPGADMLMRAWEETWEETENQRKRDEKSCQPHRKGQVLYKKVQCGKKRGKKNWS